MDVPDLHEQPVHVREQAMSAAGPIEITVRDTVTGETETATIDNDYVVICAGNRYVAHEQIYPKSGTVQLTIKVDRPTDES